MKIVVDQNIRAAEETFGQHAELIFVDGRQISADMLRDADALIIRTATRVDEQLLKASTVGFVGTTSIGTDHLDIKWLEQQGIQWASAPGCNADSAAQYTFAMIWLACQRLGKNLENQSAGIIGRGNVGSRLERMLKALNVDTVANDPPLSERGEPDLVSLEEALSQDIVSLHVPLNRTGAHPTYRFIGSRQLCRVPDGALLVNAARGDVIDGDALTAELRSGRLHAALDVWPGEPFINSELLESVSVATPHVAGYSDDGKRNGALIVYKAFCRWSGLQYVEAPELFGSPLKLSIPAGEDCVSESLDAACFVRRHDMEMRLLEGLDPGQLASEFDRLRQEYPDRRDFHAWNIDCRDSATNALLGRLGFSTVATE